jgi:hypothetical protein
MASALLELDQFEQVLLCLLDAGSLDGLGFPAFLRSSSTMLLGSPWSSYGSLHPHV